MRRWAAAAFRVAGAVHIEPPGRAAARVAGCVAVAQQGLAVAPLSETDSHWRSGWWPFPRTFCIGFPCFVKTENE